MFGYSPVTHTYTHISLVLFVIINPFGDLRIFSVKLKGLFFCWTKPHQKNTHAHTHKKTPTWWHTHTKWLRCLTWKLYTQAHAHTHTHTHTCTGATRISKEWKPQCLKIRIFPLFFFFYLFFSFLVFFLFVCACGSWASYEKWSLRDSAVWNICHKLTHCITQS